MSTKHLFTALVLVVCLTTSIESTIWDNIFSQTQASHPINLTQSFNIAFDLPQQYDLDGNIDFNIEMKTLTLTLSKNVLIQKLNVIKAQIDLEEMILNVDQFLLGCEKFVIGVQDELNDKIKERVSNVGMSKRSLFMINLLFRYIGRYQLKIEQKSKRSNTKKQFQDILDILKDNPVFNQLEQALGGKAGSRQQSPLSSSVQYLDMFEFSLMDILPQGDPKFLIQKFDNKHKSSISNDDNVNTNQHSGIDAQTIDWQMFKFVLLTHPKTGEITRVYRSREMVQEMEFTLRSNEKGRLKCNKVAKRLTFEDLTNGAKYLYDNRDTLGRVLD